MLMVTSVHALIPTEDNNFHRTLLRLIFVNSCSKSESSDETSHFKGFDNDIAG